jgi:hypothetical protein
MTDARAASRNEEYLPNPTERWSDARREWAGVERETSFAGASRDATVEGWVFIIEPRSENDVEVRYAKRLGAS